MAASPFLAIDVGATHVTCAQWYRGRNGKLILQRTEYEPLDVGARNVPGWQTAVELAMAVLARRSRWRGPVHLAVPGDLALIRRVTTPRVAASKLGAVMAFEASRCVPYPLEQVEWDYVFNAERGAEIEMLMMAAKAEWMGAVCEALTANGFEPSRAIPASLALAHAFRLGYPEIRSAAVVAVGARTTHIVLIEEGRVLPRTLPLAGNALTEAIAEGLGVATSRAEEIKLQHLGRSSSPEGDIEQRAMVAEAARHFTGRLRMEISRSLASGREHAFEATPEGIYLTGGGAFNALAGWLQEQLTFPVHRLDPLRGGAVMVTERGAEIARQNVVNVAGLAAASADAGSGGNLLPAKWRTAARFRRRQPVLLGIAVLTVAALLPPIWSYDREVRQARAENATISGQLRSTREKVAKYEAAFAGLDNVRQRCDALRQLTESRTNWTSFFAELQESLVEVEDVWLDRLDVVVADQSATAANESAELPSQPMVQLRLSGRMLDRQKVNLAASVTEGRVQRLLGNVKRSRFVVAINAERFDTSEPGILRFEFSLFVKERSLF